MHVRYSSPLAALPHGSATGDGGVHASDVGPELPLWTLKCDRQELQQLCLQLTEMCTSFVTKVPVFAPALHHLTALSNRSLFSQAERWNER